MPPQTLERSLDAGSPAWYALHTRYQHEKTVTQILRIKGFEVFLPLYPVLRRWKDRTKRLSLPLFSCYVFIWTALERCLEALTTPGIHDFVRSSGRPAPISPTEIEWIRLVLENKVRIEPCPFLISGDRVRIKSGPLEGIEGIFLRKKNQSRLVMSVELLQKSAAVDVDACVVELLGMPSRPKDEGRTGGFVLHRSNGWTGLTQRRPVL